MSSRRLTVAISIGSAVAVLAAPGAASARTLVPCWSYASSEIGFFEKPKACPFTPLGADGGISANSVDGTKMVWKGWGNSKAIATGTRAGSTGYRAKATFTASKRIKCDIDYLYTRITIREKGKVVFNFKLDVCPM
jgi:hypothetical protein